MPSISRHIFLLIAGILVAVRLFHLTGEIDNPHAWRQCDTANYIQVFYEEGIDLMHPSVCWMGDQDTVILEFPLPEALAAIGYHVFGPHHGVARMIFLLFYLISTVYLFLIVKLILDEHQARWSTIIYLSLPLGIFYSRAIHIDFAAMAFALGMLYHLLTGIRKETLLPILLGSLYAAIGLMIKAPYTAFLGIPFFYEVWRLGKWKFLLKIIPALLVPILAFGLWIRHTQMVNGQMPDWYFIPHYRKFDQSWAWYIGSLYQRLLPYSWKVLAQRYVLEVSGMIGFPFMLAGLLGVKKIREGSLFRWWMWGLVAYLLIFFNLNFVHNYYQIPFLAPTSVLIVMGLSVLFQFLSKKGSKSRSYFIEGIVALMILVNIAFSERAYYQINSLHQEVAHQIGEHSSPGELIIVSCADMDCRNPQILYPASRKGWSVPEHFLNMEVIQNLRQEGAEWLFLVCEEGQYAELDSIFPREVISLEADQQTILRYKLK